MKIMDYPLCCSAKVIVQFGGGHQGETEDWTKQAIIDYMKPMLSDLKEGDIALVFCCVTTTQPNAIAALVELGFYGYDDKGAKGYTALHRMFPFFMPLQEWGEKAFNARYNPEEDDYKNKPSTNDGFKYIESKVNRFW